MTFSLTLKNSDTFESNLECFWLALTTNMTSNIFLQISFFKNFYFYNYSRCFVTVIDSICWFSHGSWNNSGHCRKRFKYQFLSKSLYLNTDSMFFWIMAPRTAKIFTRFFYTKLLLRYYLSSHSKNIYSYNLFSFTFMDVVHLVNTNF